MYSNALPFALVGLSFLWYFFVFFVHFAMHLIWKDNRRGQAGPGRTKRRRLPGGRRCLALSNHQGAGKDNGESLKRCQRWLFQASSGRTKRVRVQVRVRWNDAPGTFFGRLRQESPCLHSCGCLNWHLASFVASKTCRPRVSHPSILPSQPS